MFHPCHKNNKNENKNKNKNKNNKNNTNNKNNSDPVTWSGRVRPNHGRVVSWSGRVVFETATPIPPADFEMRAHCFNVSYMLSMLSFFITSKKHEDICGWGVPALNNVGVAWVK